MGHLRGRPALHSLAWLTHAAPYGIFLHPAAAVHPSMHQSSTKTTILTHAPNTALTRSLAYDADAHGWDYRAFHERVDGRGPALVLATSEGGAVFGGARRGRSRRGGGSRLSRGLGRHVLPRSARAALTSPPPAITSSNAHTWLYQRKHARAHSSLKPPAAGYNPEGFIGLGEDRASNGAFLFTWPDGDTSKPGLKLPKVRRGQRAEALLRTTQPQHMTAAQLQLLPPRCCRAATHSHGIFSLCCWLRRSAGPTLRSLTTRAAALSLAPRA